jgi:hypothetical protein
MKILPPAERGMTRLLLAPLGINLFRSDLSPSEFKGSAINKD